MDSLSKTYEQYCFIKGHNVAFEEITFHDGTKIYRCAMHTECKECNNDILKARFVKKRKNNDN